jgi:hypothetical protein
MSLTYDDRSMQAVIGGFAVATAVVMIALTAMVPDMGPIWIVAGIFWMARINSLLPKIQGYIDQERRVFGYA